MNICVICPHCEDYIELVQLNCCIFRHGVYKHNFQQINPHMSKIECDKNIENNLIYGCGKPFQIIYEKDKVKAIICGYI